MSLAVSNLFDEKREKGYRTRDIRRAVETHLLGLLTILERVINLGVGR